MHTHLLVIDDDYIFRLITGKMIEKLNQSNLLLHECENGEKGLAKLKILGDTKEGIIVFLDINMPVLDGWAFLDSLKQIENLDSTNIAVYIVSSSTDESDILKTKNYAIVKQYISKPLDFQTIRSIFIKHNWID